MAKTVISFARTDTGKTISDIIWDFCKTISDGASVETSASTLAELGVGMYTLNNPSVTEDSAFSLYISGDASKYVEGILSPSDGNLATKDDTSGIMYTITSSGDIETTEGTIVSGDYTYIQHYDNLRMEIQEGTGNPSIQIDFTFRTDSDKIPAKFSFQGRYEHGGPNPKSHMCIVKAYNYNLGEYVSLSDVTNEELHLPSSETDYNREFPLGLNYVEATTGNVKIQIEHYPPQYGDTSDRLWINKISVTSQNYSTLSIRDMVTIVPSYMADAVWDEDLTGSAHNTNGTAGKMLKTVSANVIYAGTVVSASANTITLDAGADTHDGAYDPSLIAVTTGTGAGQCRLILQYNGTTQTAVVDRNWKILPTVGDSFVIYADAGREHVNEGLVRWASGNEVQLNANASDYDDTYIGQTIFFRSGTGEDQAFKVTDYNGTTKVATLCEIPAVTPDNTTAYVMLPTGVLKINILAQGLLANGIAGQVTSDDLHDAQFGRTSYDHATKTLTLYRVNGTILKQFTLVESPITIQPVVDRVPLP